MINSNISQFSVRTLLNPRHCVCARFLFYCLHTILLEFYNCNVVETIMEHAANFHRGDEFAVAHCLIGDVIILVYENIQILLSLSSVPTMCVKDFYWKFSS